MAKTFRLPREEPLLNIASYARGGPNAANRLTPSQIEHIRLTVNHAPEALVKVLPRSSNDLKAVGKLRQEGKSYVVQDGDVMHFRFNN